MWRKFYCLLAVLAALCSASSSIHAGDQSVFGPKDFKLGRWHAHFSSHSFSLNDPGDGAVLVTKNTPDMKMWRGFIYINRRFISLREFYTGDEIVFHKDIRLKYRNRLAVFLIGQPGASVCIAVKKTGSSAPPPQITFSADPVTIHGAESSVLTWQSMNADSVSIDQGIGLVDADGSISVSPTETTTYTLTAINRVGVAAADVAVAYRNTAPLAIPQNIETDEDSSIPIMLSGSDIDNDSLTCEVISGPNRGALSGSAPDLTYVPETNDNGFDSFVFKVNDGTLDSLPATVRIQVNPLNDAPVAMDDDATTDENTPVTTSNVLVNDTDIDGDSLTISGFTQPTNGVVIRHGDGDFIYTPGYGFSGTDRFAYTAEDGHGGSDSGQVVIEVIPGALLLEIANPAPGEEVTTDSITVSGSVNRPDALVFVNGAAATVIGSKFTASNVALIPGANTIRVLAEAGDYTAVASVTVLLQKTIDLEPVQVEITSILKNDGTLKASGQAMVTVANHGSSDVAVPYHIVLFEDTNVSGAYEETEDHRLGEKMVPEGPFAGEATTISLEFIGQLLFRDNRIHVCVDSSGDLQESNEANNVTATQVIGPDVSASLLRLDNSACPDGATLTVRMGNAGGTPVPQGVSLAFYDKAPGNGGVLIATVSSTQALDPGHYEDLTIQWTDPFIGTASIYARADDDGTGNGAIGELNEANNLIVAEMTICAMPPPALNGISGQVVDAVTGAFLSGVAVSLHDSEHGSPGPLIDQVLTGDHGGFIFAERDPGAYFLMAALPGYITGERRVVLAAGETLNHQDLVLSPVLGPEEIRIVLTWGENPTDLEAHLTTPNPDGCRHHCFYWNDAIPGANLDMDDKASYGPETMTITQLGSGTYRFYVHDFTNRNSRASTALSNSGATVTVYSGSGDAPWIFNVPAGTGTVWHVFNLDGANGVLTPIEKMIHQDHPGRIDFPVITSYPVTRATYGEPYTYPVKAVDPDMDDLIYSLIKGPEGMTLDPFSGLIQWNPAGGQGGVHPAEVRVSDGRCGEDTQVFEVVVDYLPIVEFSVEPRSGVNPGGEITLTWQTDRADKVSIDQGVGEVPVNGSLTLSSPDQPIPFSLTAKNNAGEVRRTVPEKPVITGHSASCVTSPGEASLLAWASDGAVNCAIDQGVGDVPITDSVEVTPWVLPTNYRLTCTNGSGSASQQIPIATCRVEADISADITCDWSSGDPVTLNWMTGGVDDCSIIPGIGIVPDSGSMEVRPDSDPAQYMLKCNGAQDAVEVTNPQSLNLAATAYRLLPGESTTLFWKTKCFDTCSLDQGIGDVSLSGSVLVTPEQLPTTYTLTAGNDRGTVTQFVTIRPHLPVLSFGASPALIKPGEPATLTWATDHGTSCTIQPDIGDVPVNGSLTVTPDHNTTYTLKVIGPGGTTYGIAAVTYVRPTATIHADRERLNANGDEVTLTWVFSNADTCEINQGIGQVQLGGSVVVHPERNTTYTISAAGPGGLAIDSVTVAYTPPTAAIHVDRENLDEGEKAILTWNCSKADTCTIDQGIGVVQPAGSLVVDPEETITYTITAVGPGGRVTDSVTLTCLAPTVVVQTDPAVIVEGESATLTWQADHAATCVIEPYLGQADLTGSIAVSPSITTTYTVTAAGRGGITSNQATVAVVNPPSIHLIAPDGSDDYANDSYTIRWTDSDYDSNAIISLYYDINNTGADGSLIASGISENPDGLNDRYAWDTTNIPAGAYYVYALIEDGLNDPVFGYSHGMVTIDHAVSDEIKLIANDGAAYDYFGNTVAISGDYAIVGAPGSGDAGAAYIFKKEGAAWVEQIKLTPVDGVAGENFGAWVSISGDTVAVGAPKRNANTGAAYVFTREDSTWTRQARLVAGDGQAWDNFGACVSISGDTLVVGSPNHDDYSGAAYVFHRLGSFWSESIKLDGGGTDPDGHFGASVFINEDTLIVGSPSVGNQTGAAFIFRRAGSDWVAEAQLQPGDAVAWEYFGTSVSIGGDYAIVGNTGLAEANVEGAVRIYIYDGTAWVEQAKINGSSVNAGESFGCSVYISGNMAAVGEPRIWNDAGAVYLFQRTGSQWIKQDTPIPDEGDSRGEISILPLDEGEGEIPPIPNREGEGEGDPALLNGYHTLTPSDGVAEDFFGGCVAMDDEHVIVGARLDDDKGHDSGSAYIYPLFSVGIGAAPENIYLGGEGSNATALSWTSRGADSVRIDPDIGPVAASGSLTLSPQHTTTYTITGTKAGATVSDSITVTVIDPSVLPTVDMSATPETIVQGASASLYWSSKNVTSVNLDNGIGNAPMTGSLSVFPIETTTYTVIARNDAGSFTASVTITVADALPTVELIVEPPEIMPGAPATLTWTSTNADMVTIEPGIGIVDPSGTMAVAPRQTTTYIITASGSGETAQQSATVTVISPINLQILSPVNGDSIQRRDVMVHGTFANATGVETGITVNGVVAMVFDDQFVVNSVPLEEGVNTITVTATDINGYTQTTFATVNAFIPEHDIRLIPSMASGSSPFGFSLTINGSFGIDNATISYTGPEPSELVEFEPDEYRISMVDEGITWFTAEAVHDAVTYSDTIAIVVVDEAEIDALLNQKWADMKTRLSNGDISGALKCFSEGTRPLFEYNFNLLSAHLNEIIAGMQNITLVKIEEDMAEYNLVGEQGGQIYSFYLLFQKTADGTWRIVNF